MNRMTKIKRSDINEDWAHSGIVEAGNMIFMSYCVGNVNQPIENQIHGAINHLEERLASIGLGLESVLKIDCLFRNIWDIPVLEKVLKERFKGNYPARKSIQTEFAHPEGEYGLLFQMDAICIRVERDETPCSE